MSLLRALRAYVGLGPDDEYDELVAERRNRSTSRASGRPGDRQDQAGRRGYLDDLKPRLDEDDDVVDITTAKIDARRADGTMERTGRSSANQSRIRTGRGSGRRERLDQNQRLLDQLPSEPFDELDEFDVDLTESDSIDEPASMPVAEQAEGAVVRSIESARSRPRTLSPESFADAKEIGDEFKRGAPVVVNLQGLDRELVRRLVDFASGVCYALDGSMEKLAPQVFLLTPNGLDVSDDDRRRIEQRGYAR